MIFASLLVSIIHAAPYSEDYNYCQAQFLTKENYPALPQGATLLRSQVVLRHGERTPVMAIPFFNDEWRCSAETPEMIQIENVGMKGGVENAVVFNKRITVPDKTSASLRFQSDWNPWAYPGGSCDSGQLTSKGKMFL